MSILLLALLSPPALADTAPGWTLVLPFGAPQYVQHRGKVGVWFTGTQALGLGVTTVSSVLMRQSALEGDIDAELRYRLISAGSVGVTLGSWFVSGMDASHHNDLVREQMVSSARAWTYSSVVLSP